MKSSIGRFACICLLLAAGPSLTRARGGPVNFSKCCRFGCCAFDSGLMFGVGCVTA
jgi:hypothetical protein